MRGQFTLWATFWLDITQRLYNTPVIYSKSQVVVTNPYASPRGSFAVCDTCVRRETINAVGLGIDLTSTYGTAAFQYHNGTVVDIGKVEGSYEYKKLMRRLAQPYVHERRSIPNMLRRIARLSSGQKESDEIRILSTMIDKFIWPAAMKAEKNVLVLRTVISMPYLPSLIEYDLQRAAQDAGFQMLQSYKHWGSPNDLNAAWAGMSYGLCEHWNDIVSCEKEEQELKEQFVLVVSLTRKELRLQHALAWNAHAIANLGIRQFEYLGYEHAGSYIDSSYWDEVRARIVQLVKEAGIKADRLIVMGESAEGHGFEKMLWQSFNDLGIKELYSGIQVSRFNATYLAARGAAELARRWQAETWDCVEEPTCYGHCGTGF